MDAARETRTKKCMQGARVLLICVVAFSFVFLLGAAGLPSVVAAVKGFFLLFSIVYNYAVQ